MIEFLQIKPIWSFMRDSVIDHDSWFMNIFNNDSRFLWNPTDLQWPCVTVLLGHQSGQLWPELAAVVHLCYSWAYWKYFYDHSAILRTLAEGQRYNILKEIFKKENRTQYLIKISSTGESSSWPWLRFHRRWWWLGRICDGLSTFGGPTMESAINWSWYVKGILSVPKWTNEKN